MFHKALEKDFKNIFQINKVLFTHAKLGREQQVLLCNITRTIPSTELGEERARVEGTIAIIGKLEENFSGYFQKCMMKAAKDILNRFWFGRTEEQISMGD
ncbi:MAG: hypothetical protein LBF97_07615 [Elusimicrobiota bacterium]|jgi:hypothetical protein|nr:hypothetical protein [Elusimicrobiota bacterium]